MADATRELVKSSKTMLNVLRPKLHEGLGNLRIHHHALIAQLRLRGEDAAVSGRRTQELVDAFRSVHYTADQSG